MFRDVGIPGVLIDIENSTCYELGKEVDALSGRFENQTHLRIEVLKKIISYANNNM
jgi:lipoate-protein ligase A